MATLFSYFKKSAKSKTQSDKKEIKLNDVAKKSFNNSGELVWAKLSEYPWWPAMICNYPKSKEITCRKEAKVHVQFFGQPPTHDWVKQSDIVEFGSRNLQDDNKELKIAFEQATAASKLELAARVETYYACVSDEDENNSTDDQNNKENLKLARKRSSSEVRNKPRKRIKLSIESDDDNEDIDDEDDDNEDIDDEDEDVSYEPDKDTVSEEDNYQSDASESEEEEIPEKRKKLSPIVLKTPKNSNRKSTTTTPTTFKRTPAKPNKLNDSISKAQSTLSKFSSPSVSSSPLRTEDKEWQFTHLQLQFIQDGYRKDKQGRLHTDPNYDSRTLHIPDSYLNSKEVSPGIRQWWQLKKDLYDTIIFFKVGKFYELYHMDATVGVKELGLIYMKGKFAHCGFPEIAFSRYSEVLVQRGYKVARVEQTETPQAMNARGGAKVVNREVCAVISKGTRTFNFMEGQSDGDASNYLLAFVEKSCNDVTLGGSLFGVCFVDTSIGKFHLGQFKDDRQCSRFLTMISQYPPVQILYNRHGLSAKVQHILNHELLPALKEPLAPNSEFWNASKTLKHFHENKYFVDEIKPTNDGEWPPVLKQMLSDGDSLGMEASDDYKLAISSLGACTWYMKKCCIDVELLSMSQFEEYVPSDDVLKRKAAAIDMPKYMILDGVTLTNLDIVINTNGGTEGTLLQLLDHCATPFGKRYFKQWLCSPSCSKQAIDSRLNAVEDLMAAFSCMSEVRSIMHTMPDLERILRRVHAIGSLRRSKDHPDSRAIFYNDETYSKKKIADLLGVLEGFSKATNVISTLQDKKQWSSTWLKSLLLKTEENDIGKFPDLHPTLKFFESAFDHKKAKETGTINPKQGVLAEYDEALREMDEIKGQLDLYLKQQRKRLGCSNIVYWGTGKNRYQLEIPESILRSSTPNDYHLKSQKKGYKRFTTRHIDGLNERLTNAEERRDDALKDTMRNIFHKFDSHYGIWEKAVKCLATLDCLMSLAFYSKNIDGVSCRPEIFDTTDENGSEIQPFIELLNCRHPCINQQSLNGGDFIPNDIVLGKYKEPESPCCVLITGPNMGGKSTLMRQAGVLLIMAQLGCYVPAEVCRFTAVDRVFTRLGARDRILHGESTFYVELSETATIFQHATKHSLVLLDELGRGTATYDGTAIASAVVNDLANRLQCRTLFSTHYHSLVEEFSHNQHIKLGHMACMVEKEEDDENDPTSETITFLYKFACGACPKSYGFNAAKLAGLPLSIIKSAHRKAKSFELSSKNSRMFRYVMSTSEELRKRMTVLNETDPTSVLDS